MTHALIIFQRVRSPSCHRFFQSLLLAFGGKVHGKKRSLAWRSRVGLEEIPQENSSFAVLSVQFLWIVLCPNYLNFGEAAFAFHDPEVGGWVGGRAGGRAGGANLKPSINAQINCCIADCVKDAVCLLKGLLHDNLKPRCAKSCGANGATPLSHGYPKIFGVRNNGPWKTKTPSDLRLRRLVNRKGQFQLPDCCPTLGRAVKHLFCSPPLTMNRTKAKTTCFCRSSEQNQQNKYPANNSDSKEFLLGLPKLRALDRNKRELPLLCQWDPPTRLRLYTGTNLFPTSLGPLCLRSIEISAKGDQPFLFRRFPF